MKAININLMKNLDHPDVKDLGGKTDKDRRKYRIRIIKSFLKWAKTDASGFAELNSNSEEKILLKRNRGLINSLFVYGTVANVFFYQAVMTGIYNYRTHELVNMRRVPFVLKFGVTTLITSSMCYALYNDKLYDEDHYRVALKYRLEHDAEYKEYIQNEQKTNFNKALTD